MLRTDGERHEIGAKSYCAHVCRRSRLRGRHFDRGRGKRRAASHQRHRQRRNIPDGTVSISLQGDKNRIDKVLDAIRVGSKKSSQDNKISVTDGALDPNLKTFTVFQWTSTTRNITNPYDLIFQLRPADDEISPKQAKGVWNTIAESTLKRQDLAKLLKHIDAAHW